MVVWGVAGVSGGCGAVCECQWIPTPDRDYWLLHGEPHDANDPVFGPPDRQLANLWWPPSQDWLVVTDIDLDRAYIGGPCSLAEELLSHPLLESTAGLAREPAGLELGPLQPSPRVLLLLTTAVFRTCGPLALVGGGLANFWNGPRLLRPPVVGMSPKCRASLSRCSSWHKPEARK